MKISEKLEIIVITYNRSKYLRNTLLTLLSKDSPLQHCTITIIDNNSSDSTYDICKSYQQEYSNIVYIKNPYNIGWADITQAFFIAKKDYVWVLADDDYLDFTYWNQVEDAIQDNMDIICCCKHFLNTVINKDSMENLLIQASLLPACIYKTSFFDDTLMKNMHDNNYTMFPHLTAFITAINNNLKIQILENEILKIGIHVDETDCSYTRGLSTNKIWPRNRNMVWLVGFANILSGLNDIKLAEKTIDVAILQDWVYGSYTNMAKSITKMYKNKLYQNKIFDIYSMVGFKLKCIILYYFFYTQIKNIFKYLRGGNHD